MGKIVLILAIITLTLAVEGVREQLEDEGNVQFRMGEVSSQISELFPRLVCGVHSWKRCQRRRSQTSRR